jgi:predicted glutamine amidotransferase
LNVEGTTDSELLFFLALKEDPLPALERMAGYVEPTRHRHGVVEPLQMTAGVSDGERLYAVRHTSGQAEANSLYVSNDARDVRQLYPEDERLQRLSDEARAVVSEPLADLPGLWREVPPSSAAFVQPGDDEEMPFTPHAPNSTVGETESPKQPGSRSPRLGAA